MRQKFTTPLIKLTSLMLILFNFFAVTAIGQEIPGIIETPTMSETALEVVNQVTEISAEPELAETQTIETPLIEAPINEVKEVEEIQEAGSGEILSGIIEEIISGSISLIDTTDINIETLIQSGSNDEEISTNEENKLLDMLNSIYEEFILGGEVMKGDEIQITIPNDTDISRIQSLNTSIATTGDELSGSYVPFQEEVPAPTLSEYLPESLIVSTLLKSEDLRLEENITDNFVGEDGKDLSESIEKSFEFGKEGEDLLFSKPLKIEVKVDNKEGIGSYEVYTKHASDDHYNKVGLSTNPETLCDEQGNPTLAGSEVIAENGVVTFYTCRASDFLLVAQAAYYAACTQPIMFTNATSSITISTGSVSASGYVSGFNQGANSIIEITGSSIVYFTVNKPGVAIGIAVSEYSGIYHSYGNSAYNAIFHSDGNLYPAYSDGPVDSAPYSTGTIYFFLLSGDQVSLHTLDGSYSYTWDDFLYEYPFYVNVNVLSGGSVGNYISEAKLAGESCLDSDLSYCGDGTVDNREQCDLGTGNGTGGVCNASCNWNTGDIDGIVTKTMSGASMCSSGDILDLTLQVDNVGSSSLWVFNYLRDYLPSGMSYISGSFGFSPEDAYPWSFDQGWEMSSTGLIIDGNGDLDDKGGGPMYTFTAQVILNKNFTGIVTNTATIGPFYQRIPSIVAETGVALLNNTSSYSWNCGIGCGDGIVGAGEQCDLGEDNGSGSVCSASCLWNEPTCNDISLTPPSGVANETNIVANLPVVPGLFYDIDRDELGTIYTEAQNGTSYVYTISGTHDAVITVYDQNYDYFIQCNQTMYVGFNGECGSLDGTTISTGNGLDYYTTGLCETTLNPPIPVYNESTNTWTWSCVGLWSGSVASCQAEWEGCGDGVVNGPELCDYNNTGGISCNNQCQPNNLCDVGNWHVYKSYAPDVSWYHLMNGYNTTGILWQYFIIPHTGYLGLGIDSPDSMTFESIQYSMNNTSGFYTNCSYIGNTLNYSYSLISSWNGGVGIGCDYDENDQGPLWYAPQNMNMEITYTYNNNTYVYNINYTGGVSGVDYFAMPSLYEYNEILFPTTCEMFVGSGCGNGVINPGEECDLGNGNGTGEACSNVCEIQPICNIFTGSYDSQPATGTINGCLGGTYMDANDTLQDYLRGCDSPSNGQIICSAEKNVQCTIDVEDSLYNITNAIDIGPNIPETLDEKHINMSDNGEYVTYQAQTNGNVYLHNIGGGTTSIITTGDGNPNISNNGNYVIYKKGNNINIYNTISLITYTIQATGMVGVSLNFSGVYILYPDNKLVISDDGNKAAYMVYAGSSPAVVLYDKIANTYIKLSTGGDKRSIDMSDDGRYVAFEQNIGGNHSVIVYDSIANSYETINSGPITQNINISNDGRYISYSIGSSLYIYDRNTDIQSLMMPYSLLVQDVSKDMNYIAFLSTASNIVAGDTNGVKDLFVYNKSTEEVINYTIDKVNGAQGIYNVNISSDGKVSFYNIDENLVSGDSNNHADITLLNTVVDCVINGTCGSVNGTTIYDANNGGDTLTSSSLNLCDDGTLSSFTFNGGTHTWSWNCLGDNGGSNAMCNASETRCGNGVVSNGEQCDDANGIADDSCNNSCNFVTPSCSDFNFNVTPMSGMAPTLVTGVWSTRTGFSASTLDRGTGPLVAFPSSPSSFTYNDIGSYNATLTMSNSLSGNYNISCSVALQFSGAPAPDPVDGICGTGDSVPVYSGSNPSGLCTTGTLSGPIQSGNTWFWTCEGFDSGATASCSSSIGYCGDGTVGTGIGYANEEQCDQGSGNSSTGACSPTCTLNTPTCPAIDFNITPMTGFAPTTVTGSWNNITGFTASTLFRGTGVPVPFPTNPDTFIYSYSGSYTGTLTLSNNLSGSLSISCDINLNISNAPIDGICGTGNGQQVYTGTTPTDLCTTGTLIGLIQSGNDWIWSCEGYDSGATVACNAPVGYCGDGIIGTGIGYNNEEQCDQGSTNSLTGSCSLTCTLNIPSCNDFGYTLSAYTGIVPILITGSWNVISGFTVTGFDRGIGSPILNPTSPVSHYFTGAGNYIITFTAVNDLSGSVTSSCSASVPLIYPPIDGACGTGDGVQVYTGTEPTSLCETGISLDLHETSTGRAWSCRGLDGGADDFCNAPVGYCGDGIIGTGIGYNNEEQCDNGTGNSGTGSCSLSCTLNTPSCNDFNFNVTPNNGSVPLTVTGTWNNITGFTVTGLDRGTGISFPYPESMTSFIYTDTGYYTAILTIANDLSGSIIVACPVDISTDPNQPIPTDGICGTGNGQQVYTGTTPTDLCTTGTLIGLSQSGNDRIWSCEGYDSGATVACNAPIGYCGDGATGSGIGYNNEEQCDDGNGVDTDACSNTCNLNPISTGIYDLALIKQLSGLENTFVSGSLVTFTITVINQGNLLATNILIIDYLPAGLTLDDPNWTVVTSGFTNLIPINLASGTSQTISINARVDGDITGTITNRAEISQDDGDDIDSTPDFDQFNDIFSGNDNISGNGTGVEDEDDHDWESITVDNNRVAPYNPNITISKTGSISIYESGDMISYTINISNTGNSGQSNIQITELVPVGISAYPYGYSISGPGGYTTGAATATGFIIEFDRIEPGEDYVLSVTGTLVGTSTQINQAVITSGSCTNCTGSWTTTLSGAIIIPPISTGEAMLSLLKTGNISTYQSGDGITYTITISNTGTSGTFNTLILEDYPVGFNYLTSSTTLGNFDTGTRERSIANIASGESAYLTITGSLFGTSNQINTAYITSGMCISCTGTVTTYAVGSGGYYDLSLSSAILGGISILYVGQQVTYVVSIVNQGSGISAHQFRIADMVPTGLTLNDPSWTLSGGMAIFDFTGTLAPGETTTKNINFIVNGAVTGIISNRVQLAEDDGFDIDSTPNNWTGLDYEDDDDFTNITVIKTISGNPGGTYVPTPTPSCPGSVGCVTPPVIPTRITPIIPVLVPPILIPPITKVIKKVLQIVYNNIYDIIEMTTPQILPTTGAEE